MNDNQSIIESIFYDLEKNGVLDSAGAYDSYDTAVRNIMNMDYDDITESVIDLRNDVYNVISELGLEVSRISFTEGFKAAVRLMRETV